VLGQQAIRALAGEPAKAVALCKARLKPASKEEDDVLPVPAGAPLRTWRAIQVLETIATPEARAVLRTLAAGAPSSSTRQARAALGRLDKVQGGQPLGACG
jgi:hypothetical protein